MLCIAQRRISVVSMSIVQYLKKKIVSEFRLFSDDDSDVVTYPNCLLIVRAACTNMCAHYSVVVGFGEEKHRLIPFRSSRSLYYTNNNIYVM